MADVPFQPQPQPPITPATCSASFSETSSSTNKGLTLNEEALLGRWVMEHIDEIALPLFIPHERERLMELAYRHMHDMLPRSAVTHPSHRTLWLAVRAYLAEARGGPQV